MQGETVITEYKGPAVTQLPLITKFPGSKLGAGFSVTFGAVSQGTWTSRELLTPQHLSDGNGKTCILELFHR